MVAQFCIQHYWVNLTCENEFHVISGRVLCVKVGFRFPNFLIKERDSSCKAGMAILLRYSVFYYILGGETAI